MDFAELVREVERISMQRIGREERAQQARAFVARHVACLTLTDVLLLPASSNAASVCLQVLTGNILRSDGTSEHEHGTEAMPTVRLRLRGKVDTFKVGLLPGNAKQLAGKQVRGESLVRTFTAKPDDDGEFEVPIGIATTLLRNHGAFVRQPRWRCKAGHRSHPGHQDPKRYPLERPWGDEWLLEEVAYVNKLPAGVPTTETLPVASVAGVI